MPEQRLSAAPRVARCVLLLLLAGLLIGRRDFAHLNLGDLWRALNLTPPAFSNYAFITETTLLALFPLALLRARDVYKVERTLQSVQSSAAPLTRRKSFVNAFGWSSIAALALMLWATAHAVLGFVNNGDTYLILRQSALALIYPVAFLYALLFFGNSEMDIRFAAWSGIAAALLCALLDTFHLLGPNPLPPNAPAGEIPMPIYGLETLPLAILGLGVCVIAARSWPLRLAALLGVLFAAWRQGARPMQSIVPLGMAGSLALYFFAALFIAWRGSRAMLQRAALCAAFFALLACSYYGARTFITKPSEPDSKEVKAWNFGQYANLMEIYNSTQLPGDLAERISAVRPPYIRVDDPEVHKLQAVFDATPSVSVRNNIWRYLVWRRMFSDWRNGRTLVGAGVGKAWFYRELYPTGFHYGEDREGLDPHNSYLNMLYRYGAVGFSLLIVVLAATLLNAFRALRRSDGDPLLEALLLYFGYTLIFAGVTVSLEGPAYSLPFWITLGLIQVRSIQLQRADRTAPS